MYPSASPLELLVFHHPPTHFGQKEKKRKHSCCTLIYALFSETAHYSHITRTLTRITVTLKLLLQKNRRFFFITKPIKKEKGVGYPNGSDMEPVPDHLEPRIL